MEREGKKIDEENTGHKRKGKTGRREELMERELRMSVQQEKTNITVDFATNNVRI